MGYNTIQVGRYNRALKKLLSMKGAASLESIATEVFVVINSFYGAENRYLESWDRFGLRYSVAGVAAQTAAGRIRNPAGSNVVAVVEKLNCFGTAADQPLLQIGPFGTDYVTAVTAQRLDPRGRSNPTCQLSSNGTSVTLGAGTTFEQCALAANTSYDFITDENQEITLLPGDALQLVSNVVNTALNGTLVWRERSLEESERT